MYQLRLRMSVRYRTYCGSSFEQGCSNGWAASTEIREGKVGCLFDVERALGCANGETRRTRTVTEFAS
jgi:hypothetical protein